MKKIFICIILLISLFTLVNCKKEIDYRFTISGSDTVEEECYINLTTDITYEDDIIWTSSDNTIATVLDGKVTGIKTGEVIITAKTSQYETTKKITVTPSIIEIKISGKNILEVGEEYSFTYELSKETSKEVCWSSSNSSILKIDKDGKCTALKQGSVEVICTIGENTSKFNVSVISKEDIKIEGTNTLVVGDSLSLKCNYDCIWESSDTKVATINELGELTALQEGTVTITAYDKENSNNTATFEITILPLKPTDIVIEGPNKLFINDEYDLVVTTKPEFASNEVGFSTSDVKVATVNKEGHITAISEGTVVIKVYSLVDKKIYSTLTIEVIDPNPNKIIISGKEQMKQGEYQTLNYEVIGDSVTNEVVFSSSNNKVAIVYNGTVLAVNKGTCIITVKSIVNSELSDQIKITVTGIDKEIISKEDEELAESILSNMSLSQKVGQMLMGGFSGTTMSSSLNTAIQEFHLGNVIYMGANVSNPNTISGMSNNIQNAMINNNGIAAFISTDQEGGRVARLTNGGTHFISNMAMGATNDPTYTYAQGLACGKELRHYGINMDLAPVLDVNNNADNPIIGIRSYSDNPILVATNGTNMIKGLKDAKVVACSKHFPGHGNTSVDSHYGLPTITTSKDELYQIELAPFISSIANGIDSIMTTHIIFSAIDEVYPATLSKKVLTDLLRNELGYSGLIVTDGMEMDAIDKYFGTVEEAAVLAVKAGVDMLLYTSLSGPRKAHAAIIDAVNKGEISIDRINESVKRIILKKIKYELIDGYLASTDSIQEMLDEHKELNYNFAEKSITLIKGDFKGLDKNKTTLIVSPEASFSLGSNLNKNSFSSYAKNYLQSKGYKNILDYTVSKNISSSDSSTILQTAKNYDQIVVAMSNVKTSNYTRTATFVNDLLKLNKTVVVIALETPYDIVKYNDSLQYYICCYSYQEASCYALARYLNGEFTATGVNPITQGL